MDVLAALGDAPTAVIAVIAIALGVVLAARGQRGQRAAGHGAADEVGPSLKVPIAAGEQATDADGLRTMAIGQVGHGAIRLGSPARRVEPAPVAQVQALPPEPQPATVPELESAAVAPPEPEPATEPEPGEEPPAPAPDDPSAPPEPALDDPSSSAESVASDDSPAPPVPAAQGEPPPVSAAQGEPPPVSAAQGDPPAGAVPFHQGTIKLRQPSGD